MKSILFACSLFFSLNCCAQMHIDDQFPGGNVILENISGDTVYFKPDLTGTEGNWFYWNFQATSTKPQTWYFKSTKKNTMTGLGAAYSEDGGYNWMWIDQKDNLGPDLFAFTFTKPNQTIQFSFAQPYTQNNFEHFIQSHIGDNRLKQSIFCQSNQGRPVEKILISNFDIKPSFKILFLARAHACEMMSNYLIEGMINNLLSDSPEMVELLNKAEIMIIPFLDKDGVENGDQGKNRIPRDHNRDYSGTSIYATTRTIREEIPKWVGGLPWIGIDLHNPWIKGEHNEWAYMVGNANPDIEAQQRIFAQIMAENRKGPLKFDIEHGLLEYGTAWNKGSNYEKGEPFNAWAAQYFDKGLRLTTTIEFPYALNHGQEVTAQNAREFGKDLIRATAIYIENLDE